MLTGCLFCGPLFFTFCFLNTVAIVYKATAALPFGTIVVIVLIWTLVTSPLLVLGGIAGKNSRIEFQAPCRTTKYPREIPQLPWYRSTVPQMAMAGFLPFSAIYIELYYIFASVWGHKIYTIYSILFIVFIILLIVTAFITVALTYFQLTAEDHEWWWRYTNILSSLPMLFLTLIYTYISSVSYHIYEDLNDSPTPLPELYVLLTWSQIFPLWWLNWSVHLWLLPVLLLCALGHVRFHANFILFRVHGLHLLWILSDARNGRLPCSPVFCSSHLPIDQMRVASDRFGLLFFNFFAGEGGREQVGSLYPCVS